MDITAIENAIATWVAAGSGLGSSKIRWGGQNGDPPATPYVELTYSINPVGQDWTDDEDNPLVLADDDVESVAAGADQLTLTTHAYQTGDGPVQLTTTGTLPAGLALATDYWIIVDDANTVRLAATFAEAIDASPTAVDITDAGTGTHTIVDTPTTVRAGEELLRRTRGVRQLVLRVTVFADDATEALSAQYIANRIISAVRQPSNREALRTAGVGVLEFTPVSRIGIQQAAFFEPRARFEMRGSLVEELTETGTRIESAEIEVTATTPRGAPAYTFNVPE